MKIDILGFIAILIVIMLGRGVHINAQSSQSNKGTEHLVQQLVNQGFQGISATSIDSALVIFYENRLYRLESSAVHHILNEINSSLELSYNKIILITKKQDIPLIAWEINPTDYRSLNEKKISAEQFTNRIGISNSSKYFKLKKAFSTTKNSGNYKIELMLEPTLGLALGGFPDPVLHQINLNPTLNLFLWKGAQVKLQGIFPISNELEIPEEKYARPGMLSFNQQLRLPKNLFLNAGVGYFTENRYGMNLSAKKLLLNGNLALKGSIGYTGYASYKEISAQEFSIKKWQYSDLNYLDYSVGADYWFSKWNLNVGISYGKFLNEKRTVRIEINQNFKETVIGFFAFKTNAGNNYGMNIAVPFFPKKYWKPKFLSIRPPTHFRYTYHSNQYYVQEYWSGQNAYERILNPSLLKYQLLRVLQQN